MVTGVALVFGYALLGAGWLVLKTEGEIQARARRYGPRLPGRRAGGIPLVSIWTPLMSRRSPRRWFSWPNIAFCRRCPITTALVAFWTWRALNGRVAVAAPSSARSALFVMSYAGIAISLWPMIVPHHYTLWQAASSPEHPGLPAGRHAVPVADHPSLYGLVLLGVPRKGARRRGLSLKCRRRRLARSLGPGRRM